MSAAPGRRAFLALAAGVPAAAAGCGGRSGPRARLRLATGEAGGAYEVLGQRFAAELRRGGLDARVLRTAASVENLAMLAGGRAELGFALADSADRAVLAERLPVAALARMYMNYVHLVVPAGSPVRSPADLAGRRVSVGAALSGTAVSAGRVLDAARLRRPAVVSTLGLDASARALRAGRVAAFFWSGGVSTPALAAFARTTPIRLLPLDGLVAPLRRAYGPVYEHAAVPAGEYGGAGPVPTVGTPSYLVCGASLPGDVAFTATRILFASRDRLEAPDAPGGRLDRRYAIGTGAVPLHPGAARYYRSTYG
ncbi:TAXI family TRAP transporter solute-binding subunit [Actinomadura sp. NEAU-AAG7]|uniref:TAXI family TRAP transporter solute-binding subunit n=1 Tax=Actinomadura sp. NEAU-AAG7 TaxID=2839640 RepID=UPI001BE43674|nr:TAXI family TRAP transporter solute-binding subunit [Actinomadura sp. NEAU-AAG7]MBT2213122.1 TAXI family TRAP transporter solute-binding subunit [Actinomadura sp. NEAU-AAG7]